MENEQSSGAKLSSRELYRLLDYLREFIGSDESVVSARKGAVDCAGMSIHLDGELFLSSFHKFLHARFLEADELLSELSCVMEISSYVRHGGVKAVLYRLETGSGSLAHDYFDSFSQELILKSKGTHSPAESSHLLRAKLASITPEDELLVKAAMSEIDEILLQLSKKLEDVSSSENTSAASGTGEQQDIR